MKTGTTYLQELMATNRDALAAAGYLFPGEYWIEQDRAVRDVLGFSPDDARLAAESRGMWPRLTDQMKAHRGKASVLSMEFLSFAGVEQARRVVETFPDRDLHVILTVRDAAAVVPAQWQTTCRNGGKVTWPDFLKGVRRVVAGDGPARGSAARMFQRTQGIPRMLEVWAPLVGRDHLHVVTVPPRGSDPSLLWERFASVVGVDPAVCSEPPPFSNPSLGYASSELLRRVNVELGPVSRSDYDRVVKGPLARTILVPRSEGEPPVTLGPAGHRLAARWNRQVRSAVKDSGVPVVGKLTDLPTRRPEPADTEAAAAPTDEQIVAAAATAWDGLLALADELRSELPAAPPVAWERSRWEDGPDPAGVAVTEVTELVRSCMALVRELDDHLPASAIGGLQG
jgi:hypothetical protein